jgi:hypothetical protein
VQDWQSSALNGFADAQCVASMSVFGASEPSAEVQSRGEHRGGYADAVFGRSCLDDLVGGVRIEEQIVLIEWGFLPGDPLLVAF